MREIGVRELKARASEIICSVREKRARYLITYRGKPVGMLMPLVEAKQQVAFETDERREQVWEELVQLGQELGAAGNPISRPRICCPRCVARRQTWVAPTPWMPASS